MEPEDKNKVATAPSPEAESQKLALIAQSREMQKGISLVSGLKPASLDQLVFIAKLYQDSGLAPKSFETWQQIAIAMSMCLEVGRPIATGLQDMAVINGRVGIFGDAALAIIRGTGLLEVLEEKEQGTPFADDWRFSCRVKRTGEPERVGTFSWEEAKRAGLDDPQLKAGGRDNYSPWRKWTRRMMQFKARNFVLRDLFGDVLKGIRTREEIMDSTEDEAPIPVEKVAQPHKLEIKASPFEEVTTGPMITLPEVPSKVPVIPEIPAESKIEKEIRETPIEKINGMIEGKEPEKKPVPPTHAEAPNAGSPGPQTASDKTPEPDPATGDSNGHTPSEHGAWYDAIKSARPSRSREARSAFEKLVNTHLSKIYALPGKDYKAVEKKYKEAFGCELPSMDDAAPWKEEKKEEPKAPVAPAQSNLLYDKHSAAANVGDAPSDLEVKFNEFVYDFADVTAKTQFINPQEGMKALTSFVTLQEKHVAADEYIAFVNFLNEIVEAGKMSFRSVPAMKTMIEYTGMADRLFKLHELWKEQNA